MNFDEFYEAREDSLVKFELDEEFVLESIVDSMLNTIENYNEDTSELYLLYNINRLCQLQRQCFNEEEWSIVKKPYTLKIFTKMYFVIQAWSKECLTTTVEGKKEKETRVIYSIDKLFDRDKTDYEPIRFLELLVEQLKEIASKKPYCIILLFGDFGMLAEIIAIKNWTREQFRENVTKLYKLTNEIEKSPVPVVFFGKNAPINNTAHIMLACHYSIVSHYGSKMIFHVDGFWFACFLAAAIIHRISLCSSVHSAMESINILGNNYKYEKGFTVVDQMIFIRNDRTFWQHIAITYAYEASINISFDRLKDIRKQSAETHFYNRTPTSQFCDQCISKYSKDEFDFVGNLKKEYINYLRILRRDGLEMAIEYAIEVAMKLYGLPETRGLIDRCEFFRKLATIADFPKNIRDKVAIIGFNPMEFIVLSMCELKDTSFIYFDRTEAFSKNQKKLSKFFKFPRKIEIKDSIESIKDSSAVIILSLPDISLKFDELIKMIEELVENDTPIGISFFEPRMKKIIKYAKFPERIFMVHFWSVETDAEWDVGVVNYIYSEVSSSETAVIKLISMLALPNTRLISKNKDWKSGSIFVRCILSVLSEITEQFNEGLLNSIQEAKNLFKLVEIGIDFFLIMDLIGLDNLLKHAKMYEKANKEAEIKWDLSILEKLIKDGRIGVKCSQGWYELTETTYKPIDMTTKKSKTKKVRMTMNKKNICRDRLMLSFLIEPLRYYEENEHLVGNEDMLVSFSDVFNNSKLVSILQRNIDIEFVEIFYFQFGKMGPYRFIDEYLHKYKKLINIGDKRYQLMKRKLEPNSKKFFSNTPPSVQD